MKFGEIAVQDAVGALLAHGVRRGGVTFKKGHQLSASDVANLLDAGVETIMTARLDADDISENDAATRLGALLAGRGLSTTRATAGRVNLLAQDPGLLLPNAPAINAFNAVHEAITLATLPAYSRVIPGQLVATIKIIPYAVPQTILRQAEQRTAANLIQLHLFQPQRAALILTRLPHVKDSVIEKSKTAVVQRLAALGVDEVETRIVDHNLDLLTAAVAADAAELLLILSASATSDRGDIAPAAVAAAGGTLTRFGMPVDPGNLLFLAERPAGAVVGLPGCARSPALNGADFVLERLVAGLPLDSDVISEMGVGGLLKEIPTRQQPRLSTSHQPDRPARAVALLLAAGASSRMRGTDKLLTDIDGIPLLRRSAMALLESAAKPVFVVLPPQAEDRRTALDGLAVTIIENPRASEGLATSIQAGLHAVPEDADALLIALADMPDITDRHINQLLSAFQPENDQEICRLTAAAGDAGNPVLFGRRFFEALSDLKGDRGARHILDSNPGYVVDVEIDSFAPLTDLDTPEDWEKWRKNHTK